MKHPCGCKVNYNWPFLISQCEHGNLVEKKKTDNDKEKREEKKEKLEKVGEAML